MFIFVFGFIMTYVVARLLKGIYCPEFMQTFFIKFCHDFTTLPALNDLTKLVGSQIIGGTSVDKNFIATKSIKIFENFSKFGMSHNLVKHFW